MDVIFFLKSSEAVLEIIFLCLAIYHFVRGIKTKEYRKASTFFSLYLILHMIRRIIGFWLNTNLEYGNRVQIKYTSDRIEIAPQPIKIVDRKEIDTADETDK